MADFGPEVFHALAKLVDMNGDNEMVTHTDPESLGFPREVKPGVTMTRQVEIFKNALFKLLMLRARNQLVAQAKLGPLANTKSTTVGLRMKLRNRDIHYNENDTNSQNIFTGVNPPRVWSAFWDYLSDIEDRDGEVKNDIDALITAFSAMPLACGSRAAFGDAFKEEFPEQKK